MNDRITLTCTPQDYSTENYIKGMNYLFADKLDEAFNILSKEPDDSPCYSMAIGNKALILFRQDKFKEAELEANKALAICEETDCPNPPSMIQFMRTLGEAISKQNRCAEAVNIFEQTGHLANQLIDKHPELKKDIELQKAHAFNSWASTLMIGNKIKGALDIYENILSIYNKYKKDNDNIVGIAETLTNYSQALIKIGEKSKAEKLLMEALEYAKKLGNADQIRRINIALIQMDSTYIPSSDVYKILDEAISNALKEERYETAYLRYCIKASYSLENGSTDIGLITLDKARKIESHLDKSHYLLARARFTKVKLLNDKNSDKDKIINNLIEGAYVWFENIKRPLFLTDFALITRYFHDHFRLLSSMLLEAERVDEAVMAFESGRALLHSLETNHVFYNKVIEDNPFDIESMSVNTGLLNTSRNTLSENGVSIIISFLPPEIVAFIIAKDEISFVSVKIEEGKEKIL